MYNVTSEKELITIGEAGENIAESCTIDFNDWIQQYGQGDLRIRAIRAGDKQPYPVSNVTVSDGVATWTYTEADTAVKGYGEVQILYYVGDVLSKSRVWQTYTHRSLSVPGEPPQPYDDWIRQVEESADEARDYAASALESANTAGEYKRGAEAAQEAAEIAQELTDQIKEEAKTAKIAAENARNAAQGYATAAEQSAAQAEETAESIEESADLIQKLMDNQIKDTATGTIATYPDGADMPMVSLVADIEPIQDLHGYDRPWVGGGGKNKLEVTATSGTVNGVTLTVSEDGTVTANGTASPAVWFKLADVTLNGNYIVNGSPSGGSSSTYAVTVGGTYEFGSGASVTLDGTSKAVYLFIANGYTANNLVFKPMIRLASVSDATYEPYTNICPISGWDSVDVSVAGKNLLPLVENNMISGGWNRGFPNPINQAGTYTISCENAFGGTGIGGASVVFANDVVYASPIGSLITAYAFGREVFTATFTVTEEQAKAPYIVFRCGSSGCTYASLENAHIQIELGSTATDYEPYNTDSATYAASLPETVYGGTLDVVSGVLTVDRAMVDLGAVDYAMYSSGFSRARFRTTALESLIKKPPNNNTPVEAISSIFDLVNWGTGNSTNVVGVFGVDTDGDLSVWLNASDYTDATAFKTAMSGQTVVYELATPTTIQLTPTQIDSLLGRNSVWADSGDVTVEYIADTKLYIQKVIG